MPDSDFHLMHTHNVMNLMKEFGSRFTVQADRPKANSQQLHGDTNQGESAIPLDKVLVQEYLAEKKKNSSNMT